MRLDEMTPRRWKALLTKVAERGARCGHYPTIEMLRVLQALIVRMAVGETPPSQGAWGTEMGLEKRRLSATLADLVDCGFVVMVTRGNRPAVYEIEVDRVQAWAWGRIIVEDPIERDEISTTERGGSGTTVGDLRGENSTTGAEWRGYRTTNGPERGENGTAPRARGSLAAVVAASVEQAAADAAFEAETRAVVGVVRAAGVRVPYLVKNWIESYQRRGATIDDFRHAAEKAARAGMNRWDYLEPILEELLLEPTPGDPRVSKFDEFRGLQPWVGGAS